jgi:hypothetical protein
MDGTWYEITVDGRLYVAVVGRKEARLEYARLRRENKGRDVRMVRS